MTNHSLEGTENPLIHPLSEEWDPIKSNIKRLDPNSPIFKEQFQIYLNQVYFKGKDFINRSFQDDNIISNKSIENSNYSQHYSLPISAQLFQIEDADIEEGLNLLNCSPFLLIKYLSREINDFYYREIMRLNNIGINKKDEPNQLPEFFNNPEHSILTKLKEKSPFNKSDESIFVHSPKFLKTNKSILLEMVDKRRSLDLHSDCSFSLNLESEHPSIIHEKSGNKFKDDFRVSSPGYESDENSNFSYSSFISNKSQDKFEQSDLSKDISDGTENINKVPKPFHFKAITLASRLLASSTPETIPLTNSKGTSKKITEWTLGLLNQTKAIKEESYFINYPKLRKPENSSIYEMEIKNENKEDEETNTALVKDPIMNFTDPFSPYLPCDQLSPSNELPELCASPSDFENICLEMTPLSSSRQWSRRGSALLPSPPFIGNGSAIGPKELDQVAFVNSSCTSPTIGLTSFTTQGHQYTHSMMPTVSKLLSQFINTKTESTRPDHEERWTIFMDQQAPITSDNNSINETFNNVNVSHPLAPIEVSDSDDLELNKENIKESSLKRKHLILSRMSQEAKRELRHLVRAGIPINFRPKVWFECSGGAQMNEIGYFQGLIMKSLSFSSPYKTQIELDVHRTMPNNSYFSSDGQGVEKLCRILLAYSIHNPSVGYCQSMNLITATLLLILPTEEEVFWTLAAIIENILPAEYFTSTLLASQADQVVLKRLLAKHLPNLNQHFDLLNVDLGAITFNWFLSLFTSCTPFPMLLRIWDVFLIEGDATLFRVTLAILDLNEKQLLSLGNSSSVYNVLKSLPQKMSQVLPKLLKLAFCVYKSKVRSDEINELRESIILEFQN